MTAKEREDLLIRIDERQQSLQRSIDKVLDELTATKNRVDALERDKQRLIGVMAAVSAGDLAPSQGAALVGALGALARVAEVDELAARVAALEKHHGSKS